MSNILDVAKRAENFSTQFKNYVYETIKKPRIDSDKYYFNNFPKSFLNSHIPKSKSNEIIKELELEGHVFKKDKRGQFQLNLKDLKAIYKKNGYKTFSETFENDCFVLFISSLKGGSSKSVTAMNLAHGLRLHKHLLKKDLKVLLIDLDHQSTSSEILTKKAIDSNYTITQALFSNASEEDLLEKYIIETEVDNVDLIPSDIEDQYLIKTWEKQIKNNYGSDQNIYDVLNDKVISKIKKHYDFIIFDSAPNLDDLYRNALCASDFIFTPVPLSYSDVDATLKNSRHLPQVIKDLEYEGSKIKIIDNFYFFTRYEKNEANESMKTNLSNVFGSSLLQNVLIESRAFKSSTLTYDTVYTTNADDFEGGRQTLKKGKDSFSALAKEIYEKAVFTKYPNATIDFNLK